MPTPEQRNKIFEMHEHLKKVNELMHELGKSGLEMRPAIFDFETMVRGTQMKIVIEVYEKIEP